MNLLAYAQDIVLQITTFKITTTYEGVKESNYTDNH